MSPARLSWLVCAVAGLALASLSSCKSEPAPAPAPTVEPAPEPHETWVEVGLPDLVEGDVFKLTPPQVLDALVRVEGVWVTFLQDAPPGWLDPAFIPELLARVESDRRCAHVVSQRASMMPSFDDGEGTEGRGALYLLASYREGGFPIGEGSATYDLWDGAAAREWCAAQPSSKR